MTTVGTPAALRWLADWPERNPGLAFLILVFLVVVGAVLAGRLSVGHGANTMASMLVVSADLPGVDAAAVEAMVTKPLEAIVESLPGTTHIETRTRVGHGSVIVSFPSIVQRDRTIEEARARVAALTPPSSNASVAIEPRDVVSPAVVYAVTGDESPTDVEQWAERALAVPLRELTEVASVAVEGALEREIVIQPDSRRLAALGLNFDAIAHAVRAQQQAAPRRARSRRVVAVPGSAEAIAARAVRLESGESIPLSEVAVISVSEQAPAEGPRVGDVPVLRLAVYPRVAADAARVAERANAHLAWLRANDLVPPEILVQVLRDQARESRQWSKQVWQRGGVLLAVLLAASLLAYGARHAGFLLVAFIVWLPPALALLWLSGYALDIPSACGLIFAAIAFALAVSRSQLSPLALAVLVTVLFAWLAGERLAPYRTGAGVFAVSSVVGLLIAWLLAPWVHRRSAKPIVLRWFPSAWRGRAEKLAAVFLATAAVAALLIDVRAIAGTVETPPPGSALLMRVTGSDSEQLIAAAEPLLSKVQSIVGTDRVIFSAAPETSWRLELDPIRAEELGLTIADVGRALAVARDGWIVGEISHDEKLYRLRLRLAPRSAGDTYDRLLLRGERSGQPTIYLRDVGIALQEIQPRERVSVDRKPAVEIKARWPDDSSRDALVRLCKDVERAYEYEVVCRFPTTSQ